MLVIRKSLDLNIPDHSMFWATCTLGYFGFLRASEFTVPNLNNLNSPAHHDPRCFCGLPILTFLHVCEDQSLQNEPILQGCGYPYWHRQTPSLCSGGHDAVLGLACCFFYKMVVHFHILFSLTGFGFVSGRHT